MILIGPANTQYSQVPQVQNNSSAKFSTGSCFLWLHRKNIAFSMNIRGIVNHEYNRMLVEKGLVSALIPGGEDFEQLGMDIKTSIVRPDLYLNACQKVISVHTGTPFDGLKLTTAAFFDLLHGHNVAYSANVRGLINQRYNELLSEAGINEGKIPGHDLEQLGMDKNTTLKAELYAKAYEEVTTQFDPTATPTSDYSRCALFQCSDLFNNALQFMGYGDIFVCAQVCRSWNKFSNNPFIWQQFFTKEKIPMVEQGEKSNYKEEFRVLYFRTLSGSTVEQLFGNFPEEIPCIRREIFEKFYQPDPFEQDKLMMDTCHIVVIPSSIQRTSNAEFSFILKDGDLVPTNIPTGENLKIPNHTGNLEILAAHSLFKKPGQVIGIDASYYMPELPKTYPDKISLCFMRKCIAEESRGLPYLEQEAFLARQKFKPVSLRDRLFFDVAGMISDPCPDDNSRSKHVKFLDSDSPERGYALTAYNTFGSSGFSIKHPMIYVKVIKGSLVDREQYGVFPCISAEVPYSG